METACEYTDETMVVSTDERWLINRILRFKEQRPDDITIIRLPENNDGCLYCKMPASWLKISPPAKRNLTDEQRKEIGQRLQNCRK